MKVAAVKKPGGPGNLVIEDRPDPVAGPGEVLVRMRASSLNYHDFVVVMGGIPTDDGRIPMSDGAGDVVAIGEGVSRFQVGDKVLSTFFPDWHYGGPQSAGFFSVPGDGIDGFAAELVAMPAVAAVLIVVGFEIIDTEEIGDVWDIGLSKRVIMVVTFVATLTLPVQQAVIIGIVHRQPEGHRRIGCFSDPDKGPFALCP